MQLPRVLRVRVIWGGYGVMERGYGIIGEGGGGGARAALLHTAAELTKLLIRSS